MCLITKQTEPFVAKKNITVYKIMDEPLVSFYQYFKYELNKLFETTIEESESESRCCCDNADRKVLDELGEDFMDNTVFKSYGQGFHSATTPERYSVEEDYNYGVLYECVIPKGSLYYEGYTGLLVSNAIIIKKML